MSRAFGPYDAKVLAIHDGDTITVDLDLGFNIHFTSACRFYGINAPELRTPEGKLALAFLEELLAVGDDVVVISYGWDKYGGRFDGSVYKSGVNINQAMVLNDHAVESTR